MKNDKKVSLETMTGIGKKKTIAGREYLILPVCIKDMHYIIGDGTDEDVSKKLLILNKKDLESGEVSWQLFGLNIVDEERKQIFLEILNRYVYYCVNDERIAMTEEMLIDHNWSFKEVGEFLLFWSQISD